MNSRLRVPRLSGSGVAGHSGTTDPSIPGEHREPVRSTLGPAAAELCAAVAGSGCWSCRPCRGWDGAAPGMSWGGWTHMAPQVCEDGWCWAGGQLQGGWGVTSQWGRGGGSPFPYLPWSCSPLPRLMFWGDVHCQAAPHSVGWEGVPSSGVWVQRWGAGTPPDAMLHLSPSISTRTGRSLPPARPAYRVTRRPGPAPLPMCIQPLPR